MAKRKVELLDHKVDTNPVADQLTFGVEVEMKPRVGLAYDDLLVFLDGWQVVDEPTVNGVELVSPHGRGLRHLNKIADELAIVESMTDPDTLGDAQYSVHVHVGGWDNVLVTGNHSQSNGDSFSQKILSIVSMNEHGFFVATDSLERYLSPDRYNAPIKHDPAMAVEKWTIDKLYAYTKDRSVNFHKDYQTVEFRLFGWTGAENAIVAILLSLGTVQTATEYKVKKAVDQTKDARGDSFKESANWCLLETCHAISRYWSRRDPVHGHVRGFPTNGCAFYFTRFRKTVKANWQKWQAQDVPINLA